MQIRNNYDKEVFNGDIGVVQSVDMEERELAVQFDDRAVTYDITELDELVLAYATTIHKSQGSEYPIVVMPVLMTHFVMLQRNLIYTGITRAKKSWCWWEQKGTGICGVECNSQQAEHDAEREAAVHGYLQSWSSCGFGSVFGFPVFKRNPGVVYADFECAMPGRENETECGNGK